MHTQSQPTPANRAVVSSALAADLPSLPQRPVFVTVEQFSERTPAFTPPALRNLIFKAEPRQSSKGELPGNGLIEAGAILRVGRKVLIDEDRFFDWVRMQSSVVKTVLRRRPQKNGRRK